MEIYRDIDIVLIVVYNFGETKQIWLPIILIIIKKRPFYRTLNMVKCH